MLCPSTVIIYSTAPCNLVSHTQKGVFSKPSQMWKTQKLDRWLRKTKSSEFMWIPPDHMRADVTLSSWTNSALTGWLRQLVTTSQIQLDKRNTSDIMLYIMWHYIHHWKYVVLLIVPTAEKRKHASPWRKERNIFEKKTIKTGFSYTRLWCRDQI